MTPEERALLIAIAHVLLRQTGDPQLGEALERIERGPGLDAPMPGRNWPLAGISQAPAIPAVEGQATPSSGEEDRGQTEDSESTR